MFAAVVFVDNTKVKQKLKQKILNKEIRIQEDLDYKRYHMITVNQRNKILSQTTKKLKKKN